SSDLAFLGLRRGDVLRGAAAGLRGPRRTAGRGLPGARRAVPRRGGRPPSFPVAAAGPRTDGLRHDLDLRPGVLRRAALARAGPALRPGDGAVLDHPRVPGPLRGAAAARGTGGQAGPVRHAVHAAARRAARLAAAAAPDPRDAGLSGVACRSCATGKLEFPSCRTARHAPPHDRPLRRRLPAAVARGLLDPGRGVRLAERPGVVHAPAVAAPPRPPIPALVRPARRPGLGHARQPAGLDPGGRRPAAAGLRRRLRRAGQPRRAGRPPVAGKQLALRPAYARPAPGRAGTAAVRSAGPGGAAAGRRSRHRQRPAGGNRAAGAGLRARRQPAVEAARGPSHRRRGHRPRRGRGAPGPLMDDPDPMTTMDTDASPIPRMLATLAVAIALASCAKQGGEGESARHDAPATGTLPQPARPSGGVTGMPAQPGPGVVPIAGDPPPADTGGDPGLPPEENPESGLGDPDVFAAEPTPADAVELVRRYYAAIAAGDYAQAHALW